MIPKEKQKLIFNDQVLKPDNSPVYWIAGVGVGCKIHLGMRYTIFLYRGCFPRPHQSGIQSGRSMKAKLDGHMN